MNRDEELIAHLAQLAEELRERLGDQLTAVWAGGSLALDDIRPGSDLDVAVVVDRELDREERQRIADALLAAAEHVPARGLEAVVYARQDLAEPGEGRYQVNVNGGPEMPRHIGVPGDDPGFWFVVDLAILRSAGRPVLGPAPGELIAPVPEAAVRDALARSLDWHRDHGDRLDHEVLNACRAWHHLETGGWASKTVAAGWAIERLDGVAREAVGVAAARRADRDAPGPDETGARAVSSHVRSQLRPPS